MRCPNQRRPRQWLQHLHPRSSAAAAPGSVAAAVPEALAFKAPLVGGGELNLADYAGKPVLLWFWAPT
jgi:hypothetical protein